MDFTINFATAPPNAPNTASNIIGGMADLTSTPANGSSASATRSPVPATVISALIMPSCAESELSLSRSTIDATIGTENSDGGDGNVNCGINLQLVNINDSINKCNMISSLPTIGADHNSNLSAVNNGRQNSSCVMVNTTGTMPSILEASLVNEVEAQSLIPQTEPNEIMPSSLIQATQVEIAAQVPASFENLNLPLITDERGNKVNTNETDVDVNVIEPTITMSDLSSLSGTSAAIDNIAPQLQASLASSEIVPLAAPRSTQINPPSFALLTTNVVTTQSSQVQSNSTSQQLISSDINSQGIMVPSTGQVIAMTSMVTGTDTFSSMGTTTSSEGESIALTSSDITTAMVAEVANALPTPPTLLPLPIAIPAIPESTPILPLPSTRSCDLTLTQVQAHDLALMEESRGGCTGNTMIVSPGMGVSVSDTSAVPQSTVQMSVDTSSQVIQQLLNEPMNKSPSITSAVTTGVEQQTSVSTITVDDGGGQAAVSVPATPVISSSVNEKIINEVSQKDEKLCVTALNSSISAAIPVCVIASTNDNSSLSSSSSSSATVTPRSQFRFHNLPPKKAKYDLSLFMTDSDLEPPPSVIRPRELMMINPTDSSSIAQVTLVDELSIAPLPLIKQDRYRAQSVINNSELPQQSGNTLIPVQVFKSPFGQAQSQPPFISSHNSLPPPPPINGVSRRASKLANTQYHEQFSSHHQLSPLPLSMGALMGTISSSLLSYAHTTTSSALPAHQHYNSMIPSSVPVSVVTSVSAGKSNAGSHRRNFHKSQNPISSNNNNLIMSANCVTTSSATSNGASSSSGSIRTGSGNVGTKCLIPLAPLASGDPAKPFQCPLCGKKLASKNVYQLHLRSHSGEKPFSCTLCGHRFSQKTSLTRHMRSHTGERPFPCSICGKHFADKERIKIHLRTHTGEKPFSCNVCGKNFSQKSTVKRHMTVHTGEKPWKCENCGKGFANRGNLTAHLKTHSSASSASS